MNKHYRVEGRLAEVDRIVIPSGVGSVCYGLLAFGGGVVHGAHQETQPYSVCSHTYFQSHNYFSGPTFLHFLPLKMLS